MTKILCENRRFTAGAAANQDVTVEINGITAVAASITLFA
jgi:hypothetical protein